MPVLIGLLRGVNVGGNNQIRMEVLRDLCESLALCDVRTYLQSGNVVFTAEEQDLETLGARLESAIERALSFRPRVILRTAEEMRAVVDGNPFADRKDVEPNKLAVMFFSHRLDSGAQAQVLAMPIAPEEVHFSTREMYVYFPDGMGKSKFPFNAVERILKQSWTARNWNSTTNLLSMALDPVPAPAPKPRRGSRGG